MASPRLQSSSDVRYLLFWAGRKILRLYALYFTFAGRLPISLPGSAACSWFGWVVAHVPILCKRQHLIAWRV